MVLVIPAIDLIDGKVVRLSQGDYKRVDHYKYTPEDLAQWYADCGVTRIHVVDLDGAKNGSNNNLPAIESIRKKVSVEIEVGGGIRNQSSADILLSMGINYIILGSVLLKNFDEAIKIIEKYPNRVIAGLDAKNNMLATEGWLKTSRVKTTDFISKIEGHNINSIIYTDIERDGMLTGPNLESLEEVAKSSDIPIIASGGVSCVQDIENVAKLSKHGVIGCIVGKAILNGNVELTSSLINKFN
jgi:phosphoribosylformimino-5-aminoimidazole carboxamide ribotide isomerase